MAEKKEKSILVFNAELQKETPHTIDVDGNGEIVLTCTKTGRFLKFAKGTTPAELKELLEKHKTVNEGQISQASIDEAKEKILKEFE